MSKSTPEIVFETTQDFEQITHHGLLVPVYYHARHYGVFAALRERVTLKMKTVDYSVVDKLATLWASVLIGCSHTVEINQKLGTQEPAAAEAFGLKRFPDQSQISRLLKACTLQTVEQVRASHHQVMRRHSRASWRGLWQRLATGERVLMVDVDQRVLVVHGTQFELAKKGFTGRKRGRACYSLSLGYVGGRVREVFDQHLDPGTSPVGARLGQMLDELASFCDAKRIPRAKVIIRGDAQYGTPGIIEQIQARGFGFLLKGLTPKRAQKLVTTPRPEIVFHLAKEPEGGARHWMADCGACEHEGRPLDGTRPKVCVRTLAGVRVAWGKPRTGKARAGKRQRALEAKTPEALVKELTYEYLLTSLSPQQQPVDEALSLYDDRQTIERYFNDESNALGAKSVRSHTMAGEAVFEWIVAMVANQLRWYQQTHLRATPMMEFGLTRLIHQLLQIPAILVRQAGQWIVRFPASFPLVSHLMRKLAPPGSLPFPIQGFLPFPSP